jgi:hypothetical protein
MARMKSETAAAHLSSTVGFKVTLWVTADTLRNNIDVTKHKNVVACALIYTV